MDISPKDSTTKQHRGLPCPGENLRLRPLLQNRYAETKKKKPQMKEQIKTPEKEISNEEITNLSDAQFKTLVIRMLTEMVEYGRKIEVTVKAVQSDIKKNIQGTNRKGRKPGIKSMIWSTRNK